MSATNFANCRLLVSLIVIAILAQPIYSATSLNVITPKTM